MGGHAPPGEGVPDGVPPWCEVERGGGPVLFVAPHGGRRPVYDPSALPARRRVNDLYTPEVTRLLGTALQAGWVVNRGLDRNDIDLNRLSDVRRHAPGFLACIVDAVGAIIARHGYAEVVFVHGWNTGQTKCDIGIGAREDGTALVPVDGACVTVHRGYLARRITWLRGACTAAGVAAPIGERYPAGHRNNLLQAFSRRFAGTGDPQLRTLDDWAAAGQLDALQLELGIPLRWPGPTRDRFISAVVSAFRGEAHPGPQPSHDATSPLPAGRGASLQFYDPRADVGLLAAVGRAAASARVARLLLFLGGRAVALFTAEDGRPDGESVPPLHLDVANGEMRVEFAGPVLRLDDGRHYLDVEEALARSRLVDARVAVHGAITATAEHGTAFAAVTGQLAVDGCVTALRTNAFANVGSPVGTVAAEQMTLAASFGEDGGLLVRTHGEPAGFAVRFQPPRTERRALVEPVIGVGLGDAPARVRFGWAGGDTIEADLRARMAIVRPLPGGAFARVTFGVARCRWAGAAGWGLFEYGRAGAADVSGVRGVRP